MNEHDALSRIRGILSNVTVGEHEGTDRERAWNRVSSHPYMRPAYDQRGTLIDNVIARLDEAIEREQVAGVLPPQDEALFVLANTTVQTVDWWRVVVTLVQCGWRPPEVDGALRLAGIDQ